MPSDLSARPGPARGAEPDAAAEGRADDRADGRDLVLRLEGPDVEALVHRQLVQDVAGRRDGIGAVDHRQAGPLGRGQDSPREGPVPGHAPVDAGRHLRRLDAVALREDLRGLAEVVASLEGARVGLSDVRVLREALLDPVEGRLDGPRVDPRDQPEREEVLAAVLLLRVQGEARQALDREPRDVDLVRAVPLVQRRVLDRVLRIAGAVEVLLLEGARVQDEEPALLQVREMHLQGGGVHRHQTVQAVPRGVHPPAPELELEARHAEERAGGRADLGREVGERRDVVAGPSGLARELLTGQLHAVARIPGEAHDRAVQDAPRLDRGRRGGRGLAHGPSVSLRRMKLSNGPAR